MPPQQQDGEVLQAYGHPKIAFFHLFWKVAAVLVYIFCGVFSSSFIVNFVVIVLLLTLDFWTTKNLSGRLLVGLRWWNETTDEGSNWRFETLGEASWAEADQQKGLCMLLVVPVHHGCLLLLLAMYNVLLLQPVVWGVLGIIALVKISVDYLLVIAVAVVLSSANVVGYTKCSKQASAQLRDMARNAMTSGLTAAISRV
ncbi:MAG: Golgi apparatus membrane ECHIDNA-like [Trebouxia sp. A1-2]|nr:MAG: Golgi apparatus membrane ECHIDNA-like [Trebouxia sp. A1-2]